MDKLANILVISGTSRNVGKTSLCCKILSEISKKHSVISIKISPHFHALSNELIPVAINKNFQLSIETSYNSNKDSSKFLQNGATISYYLQCSDKYVLQAFNEIINRHTQKQVFIVESGSLVNFIKPGVSILVTNTTLISKKIIYNNYDIVLDENINFNNFVKNIYINNNSWTLKV